jgi:hypothetical protein
MVSIHLLGTKTIWFLKKKYFNFSQKIRVVNTFYFFHGCLFLPKFVKQNFDL